MPLYIPPNSVSIPPAVSVPPFSYLQCFKSDVDDVKSRVGLFKKMIKTICCMVLQPLYPYPFLSVCVFGHLKFTKLDLETTIKVVLNPPLNFSEQQYNFLESTSKNFRKLHVCINSSKNLLYFAPI